MEDQRENSAVDETEDEIPDEFQCCVCLDLLYKPVVLACGHISCFWCVFRAMDFFQVSYCPVCRHPYNHFPSICQLLHCLLLKLYPITYKRREQKVIEEEKRSGNFSPHLDDCLSGSEPNKGLNMHGDVPPHYTTSLCKKFSLGSCSTVEGEPSAKSIIGPENVASEQNSMTVDRFNKQENSKQVLIANLLCLICKELLYRPVVLNCGHVYCETCIFSPDDRAPRCHVCQSAHPNGYPKVCLVLKHFLEEQFSEQYALRKEVVGKQADSQNRSGPTLPGSAQSQKDAAQSPSIATNAYLSWLSGQGPKVHIGVGCDYCGMCPIIGERYRCKDCKEKMGFDLCEGCYNSSSKLPGRFNQQHTPEHKLEIVPLDLEHDLEFVQPFNLADIVLRFEPVDSEVDDSEVDGSDAPEDMTNVPPHDPEDGSAAPASVDCTLEDQEGTHSTI
ncbi:E3 ubiquitin-protein ligase PRT1-like [Actinidia eriantha]|uniref:E3 ubiquitin-protein ligase PRT1-like n=1 Tax=Actinidia eriantha TaxID=165200 RepID=UPI00258E18A0|nr:E3 ubiquitin-protein ligase PRT1-like [Actinidia eriantha]